MRLPIAKTLPRSEACLKQVNAASRFFLQPRPFKYITPNAPVMMHDGKVSLLVAQNYTILSTGISTPMYLYSNIK